jgi:tripartite-type tricarboxylate transporter receptor subunit TctC
MVQFRRVLSAGALGSAIVVGLSGIAAADIKKPANFPERPVTIMICYGKGGGSDQEVAAMQGPMSEVMGVKVNRVNKPGGGGLNCLPDFEQVPADGYTILHHSDPLMAKYVVGDHDIHPTKDLTPLAITNVAPTGLFIKSGDERFMTGGKPDFKKFVAYAKKNDVQVSNVNTPMELVTMAVLEEFFGFKTQQVMFDKAAQRYGAVIGGKLDILMEQPGDVMSHVKAGKLAPILAIWPERWKLFPDTAATGSDFKMDWKPLLRTRIYWVKKETPKEIVDYLAAVFKKVHFSPSHQAFLERKALTIVNSYHSAADTEKIIDEEIKTYVRIFREKGSKIRKGL